MAQGCLRALRRLARVLAHAFAHALAHALAQSLVQKPCAWLALDDGKSLTHVFSANPFPDPCAAPCAELVFWGHPKACASLLAQPCACPCAGLAPQFLTICFFS